MLELNNISISFRQGIVNRVTKPVLKDVTVKVGRGETLGIIGDSGSGKTTLAKIAVRLINQDGGSIILDGEDITGRNLREMSAYRSRLQMVFQSPDGALNPEMTLGDSMREAVAKSGMRKMGVENAINSLCAELGIEPELLSRYPNQVSGGEIQRVALSRALAFSPDYIFLDEPTSMLDASVQAHILTTLGERQRRTGMGMVLITHDLDIIRCLCDRLMVLDKGSVIAQGPVGEVLGNRDNAYVRNFSDNWDALKNLGPDCDAV